MIRLLALVTLLLFPLPAFAEPQAVDAATIAVALTDATAIGTWAGRPYRQYFDGKGRTFYQEDGRPMTQGRWKVEADRYCSDWTLTTQPHWACYTILRDEAGWYWENGDSREPFRLEAGKRL